ncbi:MAG: hypothetical protein NTZ75_07430 [Euryarchaeota archaeon]|nr:hypothetical protein [Euryarchaeota archaeon]
MDDGTAQLLISAIIQSMATIWVIIFGLILGLHDFLDKKKKQFKEEHPDNMISTSTGNILITNHRTSASDKIMLMSMNIIMPLSILCGILALIFFRNDFLIYLEIAFAIISILLLMTDIAMWLKNLNHSNL